jgi:hypothetical protein
MIGQDMTRVKNNLQRKNENEDEKINMKISIFDEMLILERIQENLLKKIHLILHSVQNDAMFMKNLNLKKFRYNHR